MSESPSKEVGPLGIKVLLVEPGPFRTDWAGRSTSRTPVRIADYMDTVDARMKTSQAGSGKQKVIPCADARPSSRPWKHLIHPCGSSAARSPMTGPLKK